jgi:hypothetical protein
LDLLLCFDCKHFFHNVSVIKITCLLQSLFFITLMLCILLCLEISVVFCIARLSSAEQVASLVTLQQYCPFSGEESIGKKILCKSRQFGYTVTLVLKKKFIIYKS